MVRVETDEIAVEEVEKTETKWPPKRSIYILLKYEFIGYIFMRFFF